jgi:hypothetical protein
MKHDIRALLATFTLLSSAAPLAARDVVPDVPLNAMRVLGSHNSYRPALDDASLADLRAKLGTRAAGVEYGHPPIAQQLDLGLRQLEFDPYADPQGGLFAAPYAANRKAHAVMMKPGAKVLHAPLVDTRTLCLTLADCFAQVAAWSHAHPDHHPITLFVNVRDEPFADPRMPKIAPFDDAALSALDKSARRIFGASRLVTPDALRGRHATLREAITRHGWPTLRSARGKILLVLDSSPKIAETYRTGHPSLRGRAMFAFYPEGDAEAGVFNLQDPVAEEERAKRLVAQGFLVRTRSDADTREARNHDLSRMQAALRSGAQIISTDYYRGAPDPLGLGFVIALPPQASPQR